MAEDEAKRSVGKSMGFSRFIVSPRVWGYMLCVQIPYIMLNSFIFYYVPLYGAEQGVQRKRDLPSLMVNSLCSVFFGVGLTNFFVSRFKQATIYISTAMSLGALLLFAASPTVGVLIVTLLIMGISSSFGVSSKSVYFTELPQVRAYGEEQSMGVYNLSDNVQGESVGPMIFGPLMASGNLLVAMGQFVSVIFLAPERCIALAAWRKPKRKKEVERMRHGVKKEAQQQDCALLLGAGGGPVCIVLGSLGYYIYYTKSMNSYEMYIDSMLQYCGRYD